MKTNIKLFLFMALLLPLVLSFSIAIYANTRKIQDVLFIVPSRPIDTPMDYKPLEDKNGKEYLLTYEANNAKSIQALNKNYDVMLKGTNKYYPYVMGNCILAGSFFSETDEQRKLAVLNKKAAFDIFGSLNITNGEIKIEGDIFTVIGVLDDKDQKNRNIYIPLVYSEKPVDSLAAFIGTGNESGEATIKSLLTQNDINDHLYHFYDLNKFSNSINTRLSLCLYLFLLALNIKFCTVCVNTLLQKVLWLKNESAAWDFRELVGRNKKIVCQILFLALFTTALLITALATGKSIVHCFLTLYEMDTVIIASYSSGFTATIDALNKLCLYSLASTIAFSIVLTILTALQLAGPPPRRQQPNS